jgi:ATP-dependent Clp protease ATP-binding subunit ClpA
MNGYNFTERVRKVLAMAREEAARLHHGYVGTEHILLGLIREGEGVAATVLQNLSVELDDIQQSIENTVKKGRPNQTFGPNLPYSSRGKKVLELAMDEARALDHRYVGTEHLLLGLLREEQGIAAQVLTDAGVDLDPARAETLRILGTATTLGGVEQRHTFRTMRPRPAGVDDPPRFFVRLRRVIANAHSIAANRNASSVTPAHLAIALLEHGEGMANAALDKLRFDRTSAMGALYGHAPLVPAATETGAMMGLDPAGVAAMQAAEAAQRAAGSEFAGTQHLLIGLLTTSPDIAAIFASQNISIDHVRDAIRAISG